MRNKKIWVGLSALAALLAVAPVAAQVAQDFPTLKGSNARVGRNGDPTGSGPGQANLRWFTPNGLNSASTREYIVDNTDTSPADIAIDGLPYPTNPGGFATFVKNEVTAGNWIGPTIDQAAADSYDLQVRPRSDGGNPRNSTLRTPSYRYVRSTASSTGNDPRVAAVPGSRRTFSWTFTPGTNQPGQYALYVYLPAQPTLIGTPPDPRVFPQQYYVYDIQFGNGQRKTEVVNSYQSGGGWVRLGANGLTTSALFSYDGSTPIRITLYNTVPRDANGRLLLPGNITNPSQMLTYADAAMAVPQPGYYAATPVSARRTDTDINSTTVTAVTNARDTGVNGETGDVSSITTSVVSNYEYQNGNVRWTYTPVAQTDVALTQDDEGSDFVSGLNPWESNISFPHSTGDSAQVSQIAGAVPNSTGLYTFPVTQDGSYAVYVYVPDSVPGRPLAHAAEYQVVTSSFDDSGNVVLNTTDVTLDQSANRGWVRLGGRFYHDVGSRNNGDTPEPIRIYVRNSSQDATDVGGRFVYADAIRIVGESNLAVTSSPVNATALVRKTRGGTPVETKVVLLADERGVIHCLDHEGNGDGTTREYWSYPSTRDSNSFDPNLVSGEDWTGPTTTNFKDRTPTAAMPTSFDLSSALVQRITVAGVPRDFLYIASANGRVYCIDMAGRGDGDGTADPLSGGTRAVGTTSRVWTYPSTYPAPNAAVTSSLGPFRGSLAISETSPDTFTLYVPTTQGRMYALDALGNSVTNKTTTVKWAFPALNQPTLGSIVNTPSVEFGRVFFGTNRKSTANGGETPGRIFALNADNGNLVWSFERTVLNSSDPTLRRTDDFTSSLITVPAALLGGTDTNTVFALNENRVLYAIDADSGALVWANDELQTGSTAALGFTRMLVYDNSFTLGLTAPVVLVPGRNGTFSAMFAESGRLNVQGGRLAWQYQAEGDSIVSSLAVSNNWMYGADPRGFLYAWNNDSGGVLVPGDVPGQQVVTANDPRGNRFRKAKVRLISRDMYRRLRLPDDAAAKGTYAQALANGKAFTRDVFEWGETAYVLVYDFPYLRDDTNGDEVDPPTINVSFTADGRQTPGRPVQALTFDKFVDGPSPTLDTTVPVFEAVAPVGTQPGVPAGERMNGYAVLAYPLQNAGVNAVPPGAGQITVSVQTAALNGNGALQTVSLSPNLYAAATENTTSWSRFPFQVANPLGVIVPTATLAAPSLVSNSNYSLGMITNPGGATADPNLKAEALMNGSFDIPGSTKLEGNLVAPSPIAAHGTTTKTRMWVVDRSYMALLRPGEGLGNVRMDRSDLRWQGGAANVLKPFDANFPNFEDLPSRFPNDSLDYPDLAKERVRVTKDPNGVPQNPLYAGGDGVKLKPPVKSDGTPIDESTAPQSRRFVATEFQLEVDVPKYQPANFFRTGMAGLVPNSVNSSAYQQGYIGQMFVYVDANPNRQRDTSIREPFRQVNLSSGVSVDERIRITTPTVDLGTLAGGTGYTSAEIRPGTTFNPASPLDAQTRLLHPWGGDYLGIFKTFGAVNDGNVNLLNVRLAKESTLDGSRQPLSLNPVTHDSLSWLNGLLNVHSDIDFQFSPGPQTLNRPVIVQKPRVTDRVATAFKANPVRRENPVLGTTGTRTIAGQPGTVSDVLNQSLIGPIGAQSLKFPDGNPRVGVSVPIGFPVGRYSTNVIVYEESLLTLPNIWGTRAIAPLPSGIEPFSEPGFNLTFNVAETRLTNSYTPRTNAMVDDLAPSAGTPALRFQNSQPAALRDPSGRLVVAWTSNRTAWNATADGTTFSRPNSRLYVATLDSRSTFSPSAYNAPGEPEARGSKLRDLSYWRAATANQWFRQGAANYPTATPASLFGAGVLAESVRYDSPAFPSAGFQNTFAGGAFSNAKMLFVGRATRDTGTGQLEESRLMLADLGTNGALSAPRVMANDPLVVKTEPSLLQTGNDSAMLFYTGVATGNTWGYYTRYANGAFGPTSAMPFGRGFLSIGSISAAGRNYRENASAPRAEIVFTGQLRGRPYPEVYIGRAAMQGSGAALGLPETANGALDEAKVFEDLPTRTEAVEREAAGIFRTRGIQWRLDGIAVSGSRNQALTLIQVVNGVTTNLIVDGSQTIDAGTGLVSYESRLGGRIIADPSLGTIRFTAASPTGAARIFASYVPKFVRLSESTNQGGGATKATAMYDQRYVSDTTFWRLGNGNYATTQPITNDRLVLMWNRAAAGNVTARPFLSSLRFGVDLLYRLPTLPDGQPGYRNGGNAFPAILSVTVAGVGAPAWYEIDPSNGRIYLPAAYEGLEATVRYYAADAQGNVVGGTASPTVFTETYPITYQMERSQEPVPVETAVNESGLTAFLDPFTYVSDRRPPLVWLFWSSTRGGVPDIYFESIAPRWNPVPIGR